jgi:hypothetical protein
MINQSDRLFSFKGKKLFQLNLLIFLKIIIFINLPNLFICIPIDNGLIDSELIKGKKRFFNLIFLFYKRMWSKQHSRCCIIIRWFRFSWRFNF